MGDHREYLSSPFFVDDYFHIGHMHLASGKPCQDYSFSGLLRDSAYAIVSDGCSSGRHTDVGSRVVALSTVSSIREWLELKNIPITNLKDIVYNQHKIAIAKSIEAFNLELQDMLATCVYACITPNGGVIHVQGDGVIAQVYSDGLITLTSYQWLNNIPLYPAYAADDYRGFIQCHGGDLKAHVLKIDYCEYAGSDKLIEAFPTSHVSLGSSIQGTELFISAQEIEKLKLIAVFTDGVMQVEGMSWQNVVLELLAFKNLEGEFAKRRMMRFIKDSKKDNKKGPLDDISFAVIRVGQEPGEEV